MTALCWLWVAAVAAYMIWGWTHYSGLFKWLAEWQTAQFGKYYPAMTAMIPGFLIAGPALSWLGKQSRAMIAGQDGPFDLVANARRNARIALMLAPLCAVIAVGAYLLSTRLPDDSGVPTRVDIAALGDAVPPLGHVTLIGTIDTDRATGLTEKGKAQTEESFYVPVMPRTADGKVDATTPVRFLIERETHLYAGEAQTQQGFIGDQSGMLVENGLPGELLGIYARNGVTLAEPHYVLVSSAEDVATPYYVVAALGGFFAIILLIIAPLMVMSARKMARQQGQAIQ
ncbi:hypothetical protein [Sphingobium boeckii]|uniref:Uncharacterized protein n=1 Tax=Sphingobium boeckii TaxID=1082345 RepID=A0A7W9AGR8_9SPHN|nr:hypothetical protein [Sphingobium boeckii]MBB5685081.1 hypothetical protein [Sphingobium boeckii]